MTNHARAMDGSVRRITANHRHLIFSPWLVSTRISWRS
jgi:hypothetical protein